MKYETTIKSNEKEKNTSGQRNSNLELFRIVTMLFIVAHHYVVNSGLTTADGPIYSDPMSWKSLFLMIFGAFGKTGINCFVLISGYFMCKAEITLKKFCKLLFEIEFYTVVIWFIFLLTGYETFSVRGFVRMILPVVSISTGFTSCYLLFYLFIPFLNILIRNMSEIQHIKLMMLCSFMYVIIGTMPGFGITMNYVSWFIVLYFFGSYIRLYDRKIFNNTKLWGWMTIVMLILSGASVIGMTWIGAKVNNIGYGYWFMVDSNKILAVLLSLSAFLFFKNVELKSNAIINKIAASAFGVLMIHANSDAMRQWLWKDVFNNVGMYDSDYLIFHAIGSVAVTYAVCTIIDCFRISFIEKPFFRWWDKCWRRYKEKYSKN